MRVVAVAVVSMLALYAVGCDEEQSGDPIAWRHVAEHIVSDWSYETEHSLLTVRNEAEWPSVWSALFGTRPQGEYETEFKANAERSVNLREEVAVAYFPGAWPRPDHRVQDLLVTGVSKASDELVVEVEWIPRCLEDDQHDCDAEHLWHMTLIAIPRDELPTNPEFVAVDQFGTRLTGPGLPPSPTPLPTDTPTPTIPTDFDDAALRAVADDAGLPLAAVQIGGQAWRTENAHRVAADYKIFVTQGGATYEVSVDLTGAARITQRPK